MERRVKSGNQFHKTRLGNQQKERKEPRFTYSTAEYDSYIKNGFGAPDLIDQIG